MRPIILVLVMSNALAHAQASPADARAPQEKTETARATDAAAAAEKVARSYRITAGEGAKKALRLEPTPLLRWSNPVLGPFFGSVFVWTEEGRPAVVASIFNLRIPRRAGRARDLDGAAHPMVAGQGHERTLCAHNVAGRGDQSGGCTAGTLAGGEYGDEAETEPAGDGHRRGRNRRREFDPAAGDHSTIEGQHSDNGERAVKVDVGSVGGSPSRNHVRPFRGPSGFWLPG
jgi:hypothetical protein